MATMQERLDKVEDLLRDARERLARTEEVTTGIKRIENKAERLFGAIGKITSQLSALKVKVYFLVSGVSAAVALLMKYLLE